MAPYIVYRMHKVERRMVKTNAMNTQGDKISALREITRGSIMCHYLTTNDLVYDLKNSLYNKGRPLQGPLHYISQFLLFILVNLL